MGKITSFYKVVSPNIAVTKVTDYQSLGDQGTYGNYTWFQRLIQGSTSRLSRYREYDLMDDDVDVARALDIIAEEMTGNVSDIEEIFEFEFLEADYEQPSETEVVTLKTTLRYWYTENDYNKLLFHIARTTIKYGDCFFRKIKIQDTYKLTFVHPRFVTAAIVDILNVDNILAWQVKRDIMVSRSSYGTPITSASSTDVETIPANEIVRFTLNNGMSESAPFGESILRPVYKVHAQKQLLEDAIVIYRIQRAPERRVFYIDVGKMPVQKVKAFLEQVKNEFKQKKIPTYNGGQNQVESVYNPQCLSLDTLIPLLDGRELQLSEIIDEYNNGKINWVYSINPDNGEVVPGDISWAGVTRRNTQVIKLTFDNGKELICTPDHKIPIQGKGFVEAKDILCNEDLLFAHNNINTYSNVTKIEYLTDTVDVGTITVDGLEQYHNYHTFAISAGIFVKNSMTEDFFFSVRPDGKGSRVETLPGGQGLGELSDLDYFMDKLFRGLRVPISYVKQGNDSVFNDGKVGMAYIQEARFALFVERLQRQIENTLDAEFKQFLMQNNIAIDITKFTLKLVPPDNFGRYRQEELNSSLLTSFSSADGIPYMSKRFILKKYLQLSDDEIVQNQQMLGEERNLGKDASISQVYNAPPPSDDMYSHQEMGLDNAGMGAGGMGGDNMAGQDMSSGQSAEQENTQGAL